jgi:hypothetical protein
MIFFISQQILLNFNHENNLSELFWIVFKLLFQRG